MTKRKALAIAISLGLAAWGSSAIGASGTQIDNAIDLGLAYLHNSQSANGSWSYITGGVQYPQAATGAAAFAMMSQQAYWGAPGSATYLAYQANVDAAMTYLLSTASKISVSTRNDNVNICPGGSGSCAGVSWQANNNEDTYTTGLIAPAIALYGATQGANTVATNSGALAGMTWGQIAQGITNMFAASQSSAINGNRDGGWRYYLPGNGDSDMSTTQWAVISMIYDQTLGATTPQTIKDHLAVWLQNVQAGSGVACYQPGTQPCDHADTGGLLLSLDFLGKSSSDPAIQAAKNWLNANWQTTANGTWYGNFNHPYAMWAVYKGLELNFGLDSNVIANLRPGGCTTAGQPPTAPYTCNWWQDYNDYLVADQNANGSWDGYGYWTGTLATAFYLPILGGVSIPTPPAETPEPGTLALIALGLAGAATLRRRKSA